MEIFVDQNGKITGVKSELTNKLGLPQIQRVSNVEPVNRIWRYLFYFVRNRVSDDSRLAEFTRHWPCTWQAKIHDGPVLGPFKHRKSAISAEISYINLRIKEGELG